MDPIKTLNMRDYLTRLASGDAAPGGGAAAALTAAQGAALLAMALRVSGTSDQSSHLLLAKLDTSVSSLLDLATSDGTAFDSVMQAFKMPRLTDEQRTARKEAVQAGLKLACEPPLAIMKEAFSLLKDAEYVVEYSKPSVVSDAAIAVQLLWGALATARYNVWINLKGIDDPDYKLTLEEHLVHMMHEGKKLRRRHTKAAKKIMGRV